MPNSQGSPRCSPRFLTTFNLATNPERENFYLTHGRVRALSSAGIDKVSFLSFIASDAVVITCDRAGSIDEALLRALETIGSPIKIPLSGECPRYSDHKRFWDADLPAVLMIDATEDDYYPWYHRLGDTMDKVNIPYLRSTIQLSAAAAALLAAPQSGS